MTTPPPQGGQRPRRSLLLGVVLIGLLVVLTTCVVAAQVGPFGNDEAGTSGGSDGSGPASLSPSASPTPEDSGPPATPWEQADWRKGVKKNQIIGVEIPPKPAASTARKDPLRVSVATLAALDSTNPSEWNAGPNPLAGYMSPSLAETYTPQKASSGGEGVPDDPAGDRLPSGAKASYEFYCHVASHTKKAVVSQCGYRVTTTSSSGKVLREADGLDQKVTAKLAKDGWRVSSLEPVTGPGGD